jgi:membrane protein
MAQHEQPHESAAQHEQPHESAAQHEQPHESAAQHGRDDDAINTTLQVLAPIPGVPIDPPPKDTTSTREKLDDRAAVAGVGFRAWERFSIGKVPLLAAGTTYYLFLSLISVIALAYAVVAIIGADALADWLTESLNSAFPGLLGEESVSPENLRNFGTTTGIVGLVVMAYSGTGSVNAASLSLHTIYGAPQDSRNYFKAKFRQLGLLVLVGTVIAASFAPGVVVVRFAGPVLDALGIESALGAWLLRIGTFALALALNFLALSLILRWLGGIRPPRRPRVIAAAIGAVVMEALKLATNLIIGWSLNRPQLGALAIPVTMLLVLFLMSLVTYVVACLTAAMAMHRAEQRPDPAIERMEQGAEVAA